MKRTHHLWVVFALDGRAMQSGIDEPAAFFTRAEALRWCLNNCAFRPKIVKFVPAGGADATPEQE